MAYCKSDKEKYIQILETDYLTLIKDSMTLKALKVAEVENLPIYQSIDGILKDERVELHLYPINKRYK